VAANRDAAKANVAGRAEAVPPPVPLLSVRRRVDRPKRLHAVPWARRTFRAEVQLWRCVMAKATKGVVFKRCWCPDPATGRRGGRTCPKLAERSHGTWYFGCSVSDLWGRRRQIRRGGFASKAAATRARDAVLAQSCEQTTAHLWTLEPGSASGSRPAGPSAPAPRAPTGRTSTGISFPPWATCAWPNSPAGTPARPLGQPLQHRTSSTLSSCSCPSWSVLLWPIDGKPVPRYRMQGI